MANIKHGPDSFFLSLCVPLRLRCFSSEKVSAKVCAPQMAKKSELYSSLWASCDELRGGMDASQYKDYVLVLLFVKYVSDRYAGQPFAQIAIPPGASFDDMVALKGKSDIGDQINKKIIGPLWQANQLSDPPGASMRVPSLEHEK